MLIISIILVGCLILLASSFSGSMDTIDHHWESSIFSVVKNVKLKNWLRGGSEIKYVGSNPKLGRKTLFWKINVPVYIQDGWHAFKTGMVVCFVLAISIAFVVGVLLSTTLSWNMLLAIPIYFWTWVVGFMSVYRYFGLIKKDFGFFLDGVLGITKVFQRK